jgi:hypothetical protein
MATQQEIDDKVQEIKEAFEAQGFDFGSFDPDYLLKSIEVYAEELLKTSGGDPADWTETDVESVLEKLEGEITEDQLSQELADPIGQINGILSNTTQYWSADSTYLATQTVIYGDSIYECIEDVTVTPGEPPLTAPLKWNKVGTYNTVYDTVGSMYTAVSTEQSVRATSTAPDYSSSKVYQNNALVVHNGLLWQNVSGDEIGPEDWDEGFPVGTKWLQIQESLYGVYKVKIDVNGYVSGFGMDNDGTESTFVIRADTFAIVDPADTVGTSEISPFIVDSGVVWMDEAHIRNLTADQMTTNLLFATQTITVGTDQTVTIATVATPIPASPGISQVSTVTLTDFTLGDEITIDGIGGTPTPVTTVTDLTTTINALVTEITNRTGETVIATNVGDVLTLTAIATDTPFTATATVIDPHEGQIIVLDSTDPTYRMWVGDVVAADAPFSVEKDGTVHMSAGTIGDAEIVTVSDYNSITTASEVIYVNVEDGNDTTGDGSSGNPYLTVAHAVGKVPAKIAHNIDIYVGATTVSSWYTITNTSIYVENKYDAGGRLRILKNWSGDILYKSAAPINVRNCNAKVEISGFKLATTFATAAGAAIVNAQNLYLDSIAIGTTLFTGSTGISATLNSSVSLGTVIDYTNPTEGIDYITEVGFSADRGSIIWTNGMEIGTNYSSTPTYPTGLITDGNFLKPDSNTIAKAWIVFNGTGTISILDSFNVAGITDRGTGQYGVTFDVDFNSDNYVANITARRDTNPSNYTVLSAIELDPDSLKAGQVGIDLRIAGGATNVDGDRVCVACFGE